MDSRWDCGTGSPTGQRAMKTPLLMVGAGLRAPACAIVRHFLLEKLGWDAGGRECRAGCLFQEVERIGEISNFKDSGIVWLLLSSTDGLEKNKQTMKVYS